MVSWTKYQLVHLSQIPMFIVSQLFDLEYLVFSTILMFSFERMFRAPVFSNAYAHSAGPRFLGKALWVCGAIVCGLAAFARVASFGVSCSRHVREFGRCSCDVRYECAP